MNGLFDEHRHTHWKGRVPVAGHGLWPARELKGRWVRDFKPGDSRHDYFQDRAQTYTNSRIVSATSGYSNSTMKTHPTSRMTPP
ncbi:hypothetical protein GCM10022207_86790 [Streptomyces lannensis]|uniref:Uncharacterized protein n=1 Tax=Streptomyces lannensis TaxID=766498 RepID=A0ABP7LN85_9ACTN